MEPQKRIARIWFFMLLCRSLVDSGTSCEANQESRDSFSPSAFSTLRSIAFSLTPIPIMISHFSILELWNTPPNPNPKITYSDYLITTTYNKAIKI
jgi:hypothetical protein